MKHHAAQGRPGTARHAGPADLWPGPARKIMARKNLGTARPAKYWHGKILARPGTENIGTEKYWHGMARKKYHKIVFFGK